MRTVPIAKPSLSRSNHALKPVFKQDDWMLEFAHISQEINAIITTSSDSTTLLTTIAQAVGAFFQVDVCLICAVANPVPTTKRGLWFSKPHSHLNPQLAESWSKIPWQDKGKVAKIRAISDLQKSKVSTAEVSLGELLFARALLVIQTHFQNSVNGIIVLGYKQPHTWTSKEKKLFKVVAPSVAIAIAQIQLSHKTETALRQQSFKIQTKLDDWNRQQIKKAQELNQLKEEFISSMSHELRTPLTSMSLAIRMLRQAQLTPERREKYLEVLEEECNKEIDLINNLLSLQRIESDHSQIELQIIDLSLLINNLAHSFKEKWTDKQLNLEIEFLPLKQQFKPSSRQGKTVIKKQNFAQGTKSSENNSRGSSKSLVPLMINTEPDSLNHILQELLTNAGKYSEQNTNVVLKVENQVHGSVNQIVITLTNTGSGISSNDLENIFDKFHRGQGATQRAVQGVGLGLTLVKFLVERLNGTIDVCSYPCQKPQTSLTSFTVTLPQF
ncbi:MAG: GAF domain-containing sensor histidine kinase [Coleofasciculaceae cyanobacterium]